ncbi:putative sodium-coupled neutral amino acid transporter 7 isoform X4 [Amborella trichopoda]|uniref:putative sodium-coupled neutral amino acid transporter 7 isoform X4 n=1 Tax=Amborella trichopoda TaxID=13333 RepID=UPI0009BC9140|nr:putative sodium-coupled neutral amino acid transporter 7 isoform X4 [Amborella trichopoda]|eukprot:XP_020530825.1 putative sodium-coupled neutral amino acid transporter 7 isoform X4 [Amborella trichopoda]
MKDKRARRNPKSVSQNKAPLLPSKYAQEEAIGEGFSGASFSGAVFNLSTTIVGAGIMALPATMKVLGLGPGLFAVVLAAFLTEKSIDMVGRASRAAKVGSYAGLMGDTFGPIGRALLQVCVVTNNLGVLIVYMIIIGDVLSGTTSADGIHHSGVVVGWFGEHLWTSRGSVLILSTILVLAPLCSLKRVDSLRYTSALSVALAVVFVVVTAGVAVMKLLEGSIDEPRMLPDITDQASFWKLFTVVPVLITAYVCHYSVHPIENELEDQSQMGSIVRTSLILCACVYMATSLFGFLLFVTVGSMAFIFIGANFIPSIWDAFQFTGATAATCIGFIFPAAITIRDTRGIATKEDKVSSWFMMVLSMFTSMVAISSDIYTFSDGT